MSFIMSGWVLVGAVLYLGAGLTALIGLDYSYLVAPLALKKDSAGFLVDHLGVQVCGSRFNLCLNGSVPTDYPSAGLTGKEMQAMTIKSDNPEPKDKRASRTRAGTGIAIWIPIGAGLGVALGVVFGNIALGIAIGATIGIAIGAVLERRQGRMPEYDAQERNVLWLALMLGILLLVVVAVLWLFLRG